MYANYPHVTCTEYGRLTSPLAFSPDGLQLVATGDDVDNKVVKISDVLTGKTLKTFHGHKEAVNCVAFSPNSKYIASGDDCDIRIWDVNSKENIRRYRWFTGAIFSVEFSGNSQYLVSASQDKIVRLWDVQAEKFNPYNPSKPFNPSISYTQLLRTFSGHVNLVKSAAFSSDGRYIVSGGNDQFIKVWDAETGQEIFSKLGEHMKPVNCVIFGEKDQQIFSGSGDGLVQVWDTRSNSVIKFQGPGKRYISQIKFFSDYQRVVSGSNDTTVKIWDLRTCKILNSICGHKFFIHAVAISPDGKRIASSSYDKTIKVWEFWKFGLDWSPAFHRDFSINHQKTLKTLMLGLVRLQNCKSNPLTRVDPNCLEIEILSGISFMEMIQ